MIMFLIPVGIAIAALSQLPSWRAWLAAFALLLILPAALVFYGEHVLPPCGIKESCGSEYAVPHTAVWYMVLIGQYLPPGFAARAVSLLMRRPGFGRLESYGLGAIVGFALHTGLLFLHTL